MFFVFGMSSKEKELDFSQTSVCKTCGFYGRLEAFTRYKYFSFFFIPIIKWNKEYFINSRCCNITYIIDKRLGKAIEKGENIRIENSDLETIDRSYKRAKYCKNCNEQVDDDFEYCPKCGHKL